MVPYKLDYCYCCCYYYVQLHHQVIL